MRVESSGCNCIEHFMMSKPIRCLLPKPKKRVALLTDATLLELPKTVFRSSVLSRMSNLNFMNQRRRHPQLEVAHLRKSHDSNSSQSVVMYAHHNTPGNVNELVQINGESCPFNEILLRLINSVISFNYIVSSPPIN